MAEDYSYDFDAKVAMMLGTDEADDADFEAE